jgi:hypothetical protein
MKRLDSDSLVPNHIDEIESGICPALSSGTMPDTKAMSFQNPAAISCGVLRYLARGCFYQGAR